MTFAEQLTEISNEIDFELFIASHCAAIRDAMKNAAMSGFRTFQIDVVQPCLGQHAVSKATAINCYTIICDTNKTKTKIVLVAKKIEDFLYQQGFKDVIISNFSNSCWLTRLLKVEW